MEYFGEDGELGWTSNLPWPRANLEMARLPGRVDFSADSSPEDDASEKESSDESASGPGAPAG
jgi:hypothetical protein